MSTTWMLNINRPWPDFWSSEFWSSDRQTDWKWWIWVHCAYTQVGKKIMLKWQTYLHREVYAPPRSYKKYLWTWNYAPWYITPKVVHNQTMHQMVHKCLADLREIVHHGVMYNSTRGAQCPTWQNSSFTCNFPQFWIENSSFTCNFPQFCHVGCQMVHKCLVVVYGGAQMPSRRSRQTD